MSNKNIIYIFILAIIVFLLRIQYDNKIVRNELYLGEILTKGDINGDGKVSSIDYILIRKYILKTSTLSEDAKKRADVNNDDIISSIDYIMIRKMIINGVTTTLTPTQKPTIVPTQKPTPSEIQTSKIHFIKTGDSDAILIESNGHFGLVDAARNDNLTINYLQSVGVKYLDFVIATHLHDDHIGGMGKVANSFVNSKTNFYYRNITNGYADSAEPYDLLKSVVNSMRNNAANLHEVTNSNPKFSMGDFTIELLNTESASSDEKMNGKVAGGNKDTIVAYIQYKGKYGTLLTGDIESQDEYRMVSKLSSRPVDVLKIAHHSWQSSTTMKFTRAISPKIAIVTSNYLLDDISTPVYYMQKAYGTKFYLTNNASNAVIVDYSDSLNVSPSNSIVNNYNVIENNGNWKKLQNGIWFYQSNSSLNSILYDDWVKTDGKWYYVGLQGNMMKGWIEVNHDGSPGLYYLGKDGAMVTGWAQPVEYSPYNNSIANNYYETGWYTHINYSFAAWYTYNTVSWANGKNWFYFNSNGKMLSGGCYTIDSKKECFKDSGIWIEKEEEKNTTTKNGWIEESGNWYYYSNGSKVKNDWCQDGSDWYYAGDDGIMLKNKWIQYNSKWYYLGNDAKMVTNTTLTIDGTSYHFNSSGICDSSGC